MAQKHNSVKVQAVPEIAPRTRPERVSSASDIAVIKSGFAFFAEMGQNVRRVLALAEVVPDEILQDTRGIAENFLMMVNREEHRNNVWAILADMNVVEVEAVRDVFLYLLSKDMKGSSIK